MAMLSRRKLVQEPVDEEADFADSRPDPEEEYSRQQQQERLAAAIRRLPISYRQVVTLALEGMGYGEIAKVLGIEISNVGVRLTRARVLLRNILENTNGL